MTRGLPVETVQRKEHTPMEHVFNIFVFVLFATLWLGFAFALFVTQGSLDAVWRWITGQHQVIQVVIWILFLPVVMGLWIWESAWPLLLRLTMVVGIGLWNVYLFFPGYLFRR